MAGSDLVIQAFTDLAPRYEQAVDRELQELWGVSYRDFIRRVVEIVPVENGQVVLDVATGTAQIPVAMATQWVPGRTMIGLDITPAMLKCGLANIKASRMHTRIELVCASGMNMPFAADAFDVVICALATHHMDIDRLLCETRRVLKKEGQLVLADVGVPSLWRSFPANGIIRLATLLYSRTHRSARAQAEAAAVPNIRTVVEWQTILSACGFARVEIVARFRARRLWYPGALFLKATKASCDTG